MEKVCQFCNNKYETKDKRRKFCSLGCSGRNRKRDFWEKRARICSECGKEYFSKDKRRKFCSRRCSGISVNKQRNGKSILTEEQRLKIGESLKKYHANRIGKKKHFCKECKKEFVANKNSREYCSQECYNAYRKASLKKQISYRTFHKILKRAFPDWKCPFCGWEHSFAVHHIEGRKNNNFDSLVMLCPNHHSAAHLNMIEKEELRKHTIGNNYTKEYLLLNFYKGNNSEFNFSKVKARKETRDKRREDTRTVFMDENRGSYSVGVARLPVEQKP